MFCSRERFSQRICDIQIRMYFANIYVSILNIFSDGAHEAIWVKEFITDLGVIPNASGPIKLFCDNTGAIALAKEPRFHKKTRHIKRRFNSIRENVQGGDIEICKVHTDLNIADPLTKPLPRAKHDQHQNSMGVRFITM